MLSPHAVARQRALFTLSLDADRQRRAAGLGRAIAEDCESIARDGRQHMELAADPQINTEVEVRRLAQLILAEVRDSPGEDMRNSIAVRWQAGPFAPRPPWEEFKWCP